MFGNIRTFQSRAIETKLAVQEFYDGIQQPDMEFVMFFCSPRYDLEIVAHEMQRLFVGVQIIGCTTAGEIGPAGYCEHSLSGTSFSGAHFTVSTALLVNLHNFEFVDGHIFAKSLLMQLRDKQSTPPKTNCFGLMLIDGLSVREEPVAHALQHALGNIPLIGGSAGDENKFNKSYVYSEGRFHSDAAVLVLVATDLPFLPFKTQHFTSSDVRMVVTQSDAARRVVYEINGLPAAAEYARQVGVELNDLDSMRFAASPVVVKIGGTEYVRSIQKANPDGSLTFYCAIEDGIVLRLAHGVDMIDSLEKHLRELHEQIGETQLIIGFDCIWRSLEFTQAGFKQRIGEIYRNNHLLGFNSYGEQYLGIHVNQTLTGVAIGVLQENGHV